MTIARSPSELTPDQKFALLVKAIDGLRKIGHSNRLIISVYSLTGNGQLSNDDLRLGLVQLKSGEPAIKVIDFFHTGTIRDDSALEEGGFDENDIIEEANNVVFGPDHDYKSTDKIALLILPRFEFILNVVDSSMTRRVSFDIQNGHLFLDNQRVYTASLTGPEFQFLSYLWNNWQKQLSYFDIYQFVREKLGNTDSNTSQNFCAKMKSNIRVEYPLIDSIITIPTRKHFMMTDPIQETTEAIT